MDFTVSFLNNELLYVPRWEVTSRVLPVLLIFHSPQGSILRLTMQCLPNRDICIIAVYAVYDITLHSKYD